MLDTSDLTDSQRQTQLRASQTSANHGKTNHRSIDRCGCSRYNDFLVVVGSGVKSSPEIYLSKSIATDGGNYLK